MTNSGLQHFRASLLAMVAALSTMAVAAPALAHVTGPDVSSWQHPKGTSIDWSQVKGNGRPFAFVKATEDVTYTNPYFATDWAAIKAQGMFRGAYHFARPAASAFDQATFFATVIGDLQQPGSLPPVLDLEATGGLGPADLVSWTHTFLTRLQDLTGRTPMIYASPNFWTNAMGNSQEFTGYPLWIARWTSAANPDPLPGGWTTWTFWQYTDVGAIPGITGNVDISRFNGVDAALATYATVFTDLRCVSAGTGPIVSAIGPDGALWFKQGSDGWRCLRGKLIEAPAVASIPQNGGPGVPLYLGLGPDHDLYVRTANQNWQNLSSQPLYCIGSPAATVAGGPGNAILYVACQGGDHALWFAQAPVSAGSLPSTSGGDWRPLGGRLNGGPAVAVIAGDSSPTFFAIGTDNSVWSRGILSPYRRFDASCSGHPAAATMASTSYFACDGLDHGMWFAANFGSGWGGTQAGGGNLVDGPGLAVHSGGATVYVEGADGGVWERSVSGNTPVSGWANDNGRIIRGVGAVNSS